jgi:hypothetical protein
MADNKETAPAPAPAEGEKPKVAPAEGAAEQAAADAAAFAEHQAAVAEAAGEEHEAAAEAVTEEGAESLGELSAEVESAPVFGAITAVREAKEWLKSEVSHDIIPEEGKRDDAYRELVAFQAQLGEAKTLAGQEKYSGSLDVLEALQRDKLDAAVKPLGTVRHADAIRTAITEAITNLKTLDEKEKERIDREGPDNEDDSVPDAPDAESAPEAAPEAAKLGMTAEEDQKIKEKLPANSAVSEEIKGATKATYEFSASQGDALKEEMGLKGKAFHPAIDRALAKANGKMNDIDTLVTKSDALTLDRKYPEAKAKLAEGRTLTETTFKETIAETEALKGHGGLNLFSDEAQARIKGILQVSIDKLAVDKKNLDALFAKKTGTLNEISNTYTEVRDAMTARAVAAGVEEDKVDLSSLESAASEGKEQVAEQAASLEQRSADLKEELAKIPAPTDADKAMEAMAEVFALKDDLGEAMKQGGLAGYGKALVLIVTMIATVMANIGPLMEDSGGFTKLYRRIFPEEEKQEKKKGDKVKGPEETTFANSDAVLESLGVEGDKKADFKGFELKHFMGGNTELPEPLKAFKEADPDGFTAIQDTLAKNEVADYYAAHKDDEPAPKLGAFIDTKLSTWKTNDK